MITDDLYSLAPQFQFTTDTVKNSIYGIYKGFGMVVKAVPEKNCFVFTTWARKGALSNVSVNEWIDEYSAKSENSYIKAKNVNGNTVSAVLLADSTSEATCSRLHGFVFDITSFFMMNYYTNACSKCGSSIGLTISVDSDGALTQLCKMCGEKEADEIQQNAAFVNTQQEQPVQHAEIPGYAMPNPEPQTNLFAQPQDNSFAQPMQNAYAQPMQNAYAQPMQNAYAQPMQNAYAQPMQNAYAQPVQNAYTQPVNNNFGGAMGVIGSAAGMMGGSMDENTVTPAQGGMNIGSSSMADTMDSIDPNTAPESTGFSTPESVAAIPMPTQVGMQPDYSAPVIENDFRADPSYMNAPPVYSSITPAQIDDAASNPLMGFLGAVIFGLIGCFVWYLFGMAGRISWLGGLAMAFSTVTGYKLFGKKFDKFGIISCLIVIALGVLASNIIIIITQSEFATIAQFAGFDGGFFSSFFNFFSIIERVDVFMNGEIMGAFIRDLLIGYLFAIVAFLVYAIPKYKEDN